LKVLHITPTYIPAYRYGGTIFSVHRLCKELVKQGVDVTVYTSNLNGNDILDVKTNTEVIIDGVRVIYFPSKILKKLYYMPLLKQHFLKNVSNYDLVHCHSVFNYAQNGVLSICKKRGIPFILSPRGMLESALIRQKSRWLKAIWLALVEKNNLFNADYINFTSDRELEEYKKLGLPIKNSYILGNGIELQNRKKETRRDQKSILFVGRINWKKNIDIMIESIALLPGYKLIIVGPDSENYWKKLWELVKKLSLENRVEYIGEKYGADKQDLFRNAGCLALISKSENFGNVVIEAMSYNTPVIVSKGVGISDTIEKTNSGLVIEPSAIQLAESVKKMENEELRKAILSNANKLIQNKYSIEFVVKETKKIYQICINEKHTNIRAPKCV